jgi:Uma2 family endonuclease
MATVGRLMTEAEFLALPEDDGITRELIQGELRERPSSMTTRRYSDCTVCGQVAYHLISWRRSRPKPWGSIVVGEARVRLRRDPLTFVGVDVAYLSPETKPASPRKAGYVDGPPVLAVEVLSPSDTIDEIDDKVDEYLDAGVAIVWVVDPRHSTVTVYRPDAKPQLFNADQELTAEPHLPGFRVDVGDFFEDLED